MVTLLGSTLVALLSPDTWPVLTMVQFWRSVVTMVILLP